MILHDSNKLEDYSLDPVNSPPIDYGSLDVFDISNDRAFAYFLKQYELTWIIRPYQGGNKGESLIYKYWNFDRNSSPKNYPETAKDFASRGKATFASGFGKIFIHSGKNDEGIF